MSKKKVIMSLIVSRSYLARLHTFKCPSNLPIKVDRLLGRWLEVQANEFQTTDGCKDRKLITTH